MSKIVYVALAAFALWSCGNNNRNNDNNIDTPVPPVVGDVKEDLDDYYTDDNSSEPFEYAGTYKGTLPCADCEGIETVIRLGDISNGDASYTVTTTYLGKDDARPFVQKGNFRWGYDDDKDGTYVILEGIEDGPTRYLIDENSLTQLDMDGNYITGTNAQHYVLKKQ